MFKTSSRKVVKLRNHSFTPAPHKTNHSKPAVAMAKSVGIIGGFAVAVLATLTFHPFQAGKPLEWVVLPSEVRALRYAAVAHAID